MYLARLIIENFRCFGSGSNRLSLRFGEGLTALVGENDTGKTAVIDALRFVLGTRDQEYQRVQDSDFHCPSSGEAATEISIRCCFEGLTYRDKEAFAEYLTYVDGGNKRDIALYINWTAKDLPRAQTARRFHPVEVRSGKNGDGPVLDGEVRHLLRVTYLRPLRDADHAMTAGRGSRLSQILQHTREINEVGVDYDPSGKEPVDVQALSVLGVADYASELIRNRKGIRKARARINDDYLSHLSFENAKLTADIDVRQATDKEGRLRQILEKLDLGIRDPQTPGVVSNRGLGSNNVLFMACELLLLGAEEEGFPMLLIEEPEAHLHPQRQLRLMKFLQDRSDHVRSDEQRIQVIVTTHSPNLASTINLRHLVLLGGRAAFPLHEGATNLDVSDYRFLERFLDVTKSNLFFARGVMIVEGSAENILMPVLARLLGRDFTEHGVSIVNVGGTGLRRFARVFQRKQPAADGEVPVPVACVADVDVMPDCAPEIVGLVKPGKQYPDLAKRRWRVKSDFSEEELRARTDKIRKRADGQRVQTFVSEEWTFEYELARAGLGKDVWIAAHLARADDGINSGDKNRKEIAREAEGRWAEMDANFTEEEIASKVYGLFVAGSGASKPIAAQYLAERLEERAAREGIEVGWIRGSIPGYLVAAVEYVTGVMRGPDAQ